MEWIVATGIVTGAAILATRRSSWLLDYAIYVLAFNRCIRRMVDYYFNGQFNPFSPISLTPLLVAGLMVFPAILCRHRLSRYAQRPFAYLSIAVILGFLVGAVLNRFAAVYSLVEWTSSLATMAFAATQPVSSKVADRWIRSAGWAGVGVAAYGWWQYYTIPPWDGMWLVQSGMAGYMGLPEPTKMTVFSTLNERGPCGGFLAWAVIPMIIKPQWRNIGGWLSVALLLSVIVLTETRSNLIIIGIVTILMPALSRGRGLGRVILLSAMVILATTWGIERIPGLDKMKTRFEAESLYGEGSSAEGRIGIYASGLSFVAHHPLGLGLGSSGMGSRVEAGEVEGIGDSGYIQIFAQFGWIGGVFFFLALWKLWQEMSTRWIVGCRYFGIEQVNLFIPATRSILIGSLIFLIVSDIFAGFSLIWVFFGRALSGVIDPKLRLWLARPAVELRTKELMRKPLRSTSFPAL